MKTCYTWFTTRNSLLQTSRKSPCSEKHSTNSCHESNTSNPNLPSQLINKDFSFAFRSVRSSMVSTITRICPGRSGVQILQEPREPYLLQNIQASSSAHASSMSTKTRAISAALKWPGQTFWSPTTAKFRQQWSYTSTQPVWLHGTYWDNFILPQPPTYVHITQPSSWVILMS